MNPTVWTFFIVVVAVCLVAVFVLKYLSGVVADRRTRKIILDGMSDNASKESDHKESTQNEEDK